MEVTTKKEKRASGRQDCKGGGGESAMPGQWRLLSGNLDSTWPAS